MQEVYRILDANFNRAREALRVLEDFARFALDDAGLSGSAKDLRSRLQEAYQHFPADALLAARNAPGDVGAAITSPTEPVRPDAAAVVVAAAKRLSEALRTLEEYAKLTAADQAGKLERLRYAAYDLEQRFARRIAAGQRFERVRLYVLLTSSMCKLSPLAVAEAALAGGAECIQLREKALPDGRLLELAGQLRKLTAGRGALFIVNDRPDIAALVGADGVHLGQDDLPVEAARRLLPLWAIVGKSTHTIAQARAAAAEGADYISVGPMFPTSTKDAGPVAGIEFLRQAVAEVALPQVAIGGITPENAAQVVSAGARRLAVCSSVISSDDPAGAARAIRSRLP